MRIVGKAETREVWIDGKLLLPETSQKVWNHSPDGFAWGYGGSGPSQLALAILLASGVPPREASLLHHTFKWQHVANWKGDFDVSVNLNEWLAENWRHQ